MKKPITQIIKNAIAVAAIGAASFTANAQKLPTIQTTGVYAPADVKIDGKPTEWKQFQAYNKTTHIYYTVANDANNLYLIVQATEIPDVQKIIAGGLTLTIKNSDKNSTVTPVAIAFPRMYAKDFVPINSKIKNEQTDMDAELPGMNKQLTDNAQFIQVAGIKEVTDTLISVYNDQGIRAVSLLNNKKTYTYELALPLKYVQQAIGGDGSFAYNIKLNGRLNALKMPAPSAGATNVMKVVVVGGYGTPDPAAIAAMHDLNEPTDFSGTYTLAKK